MQSTVVTPANENTYFVLGNLLQFLNEPGTGEDDISVMTAALPAGCVIPLHGHASPEIFFILEGTIEVYQDSYGWKYATEGQLVIIPGGAKHAVRNTSNAAVRSILISKAGIHDFFRELARPFDAALLGQPPSQEDMKRLFDAAIKHGYWIGSPEENAFVGIALP